MFLKNLKFFLRSFRKDKTFVTINLFGMTAGILVALLTGFYAFYQFSYDKFVQNHENIYRIEFITNYLGNVNRQAKCSQNLANVLKSEVPGIKDIMAIMPGFSIQFDCDEKPFKLDNWIFTTRNFLNIHDIEFLSGTKDSGLTDSKSLLITESLASKYFADQDPIGKELVMKNANVTRFIITGVIKNLPPNSHIQTEAIGLDSSQWSDRKKENDYDPQNLFVSYKYIYLVLEDNTTIDQVLQYFPSIKEQHMASYLEENGIGLELTSTKIADTHFKQGLFGDLPVENLNSIYYFLLVALIVIMISIINYINLSLARHTNRNIDIGIRKTIGATKSQIFRQYLSESFLFIIISFAMSFIIFLSVLPSFSDFVGIDLIGARFSYSGLLLLVPFFFLVAFLTGFYPALITAGKNPIQILHNKKANQKHTGKRVFIIIQIILSITFFIGTMMIFLQMQFVKNINKGYDLENVIAYEYYNYGPSMPSCDEICEKLRKSAYINDVAVSTKLPGQDIYTGLIDVELPDRTIRVETGNYNIDENYLPFMDIDLIYGRNFDKNIASDSAKVIVNEAFARNIGSPEDVIGVRVYYQKENEEAQKLDAEIIGVVSDYYLHTMHHKIAPLVLTNIDFAPNFFHIKYNSNNLKYITEHSQKTFDEMKQVFAATKHFPEEELLRKYETEKHLSEMTVRLAILSILLSIMGVFGLTAFVVRNNMKMLSVRKVFGAEKRNLFRLMLLDYSSVIIISNIVAVPFAWFICTKWLERFVYHISLSVWLFISGIAMSLLIVFLAISYHILYVNKANPVEYLKDE